MAASPGKYGVLLEFEKKDEQKIKDACGMVPVRRMLREVILVWLNDEEVQENE